MYVISPAQMNAYEQDALRRFEDEMVIHSQSFSPKLTTEIGDTQLRVALRQAMSRAEAYGFNLRGPIRLYIELTFLYGSAFDTDSQYPWAAKLLHASEDQMQRAEGLYEKTIEYQALVSGPEASNTRQALKELTVLARRPLPYSSDDAIPGILKEMTRIFPQKAAYIGEPSMTAIIHKGIAEARSHRFPEVHGETLLVALMFAFGHGCIHDPLYPWIERTLKDEKITDPSARAERLQKKAMTWVTRVLASPSEQAQP